MSNETEKTMAAEGTDSLPTGESDEAMPSDWTTAQVEQWKEQAGKAQEHWERLLRVSADLENFKKRAARERQDAIRFANESLIQKLLPVLDNLEMALTAANSETGNSSDALKTGVSMIQTQLKSALAEAGLEEIDANGKPFDPNWHEAVAQLPSAEVPEGQVLQQTRKGFKIKDRLIRPASVIVSKQPAD
jgi:molecular chaperone GrpE